MATVINNPDTGRDSGGAGVVVGILLVVLLLVVFLVFGLPYLRDRGVPAADPNNASINVELPSNLNPGNTTGGGGESAPAQ